MTKDFFKRFINIEIVQWVKMFDCKTGEWKTLSPNATTDERNEFASYILPYLANGEKTGEIMLKDGSWLYRVNDGTNVFKRAYAPEFKGHIPTEIDNLIAQTKRTMHLYGC